MHTNICYVYEDLKVSHTVPQNIIITNFIIPFEISAICVHDDL